MFSNASNFVHGVDKAFLIIGGFAVFFLVSFTAIMIFFIVKYNRKRNPKATQVRDNTLLEVVWTTLPILLVLFMFYIGWEGFLPMRQDPKGAMKVKAIAQMWKWSFEYEDNKQSDTLVLPINKPVRIDLVSKDVIHGFFIPAFRIKEDVVPGKNNYSWFIPGELGDFDLICSAYCGVSHSYMTAVIRVVSQQKYDEWIAALPSVSAASSNPGFTVLQNNACTGCHSIDGSALVGPSFKGLFGSTIEVKTNGVLHKVKVDEEYIETSIYDPDKDIAKDFTPGIMKPYTNIIKDNDIKLINDYLKTLK
jgi:cytochrome c oxidase subunit 2